ncbi:MAG: hypothetical protein QXT86_12885 [Archaeoglobaceae archaeon]
MYVRSGCLITIYYGINHMLSERAIIEYFEEYLIRTFSMTLALSKRFSTLEAVC